MDRLPSTRVYCTACGGEFTLSLDVAARRKRLFCPYCETVLMNREGEPEADWEPVSLRDRLEKEDDEEDCRGPVTS